jgi:hypothetical protein
MKKNLALLALLGTLVLGAARAQAQVQLLVNGGLDVPGVHETDVAVGWTLAEGPLNTEVPPALANSATFASFADRVDDPLDPDEVGLWLRSFAGGLNATAPPTVFAHLTQSVPGVPGLTYNLSAWSRFETHYAGGVANLNDGAPEAAGESTTDGPASPTNTELALEFLGLNQQVLGGSVVKELLADGQSNDGVWRQHFLSGVAPAGTLLVQVRGSMIDGVLNPGVNPQSAFLDDFSLTAIPEPSTFALLGLGLVAAISRGRRK